MRLDLHRNRDRSSHPRIGPMGGAFIPIPQRRREFLLHCHGRAVYRRPNVKTINEYTHVCTGNTHGDPVDAVPHGDTAALEGYNKFAKSRDDGSAISEPRLDGCAVRISGCNNKTVEQSDFSRANIHAHDGHRWTNNSGRDDKAFKTFCNCNANWA